MNHQTIVMVCPGNLLLFLFPFHSASTFLVCVIHFRSTVCVCVCCRLLSGSTWILFSVSQSYYCRPSRQTLWGLDIVGGWHEHELIGAKSMHSPIGRSINLPVFPCNRFEWRYKQQFSNKRPLFERTAAATPNSYSFIIVLWHHHHCHHFHLCGLLFYICPQWLLGLWLSFAARLDVLVGCWWHWLVMSWPRSRSSFMFGLIHGLADERRLHLIDDSYYQLNEPESSSTDIHGHHHSGLAGTQHGSAVNMGTNQSEGKCNCLSFRVRLDLAG